LNGMKLTNRPWRISRTWMLRCLSFEGVLGGLSAEGVFGDQERQRMEDGIVGLWLAYAEMEKGLRQWKQVQPRTTACHQVERSPMWMCLSRAAGSQGVRIGDY
jgi:hypothetical protein